MPNASSSPNIHQARRYIRRIKHELGPSSPRYRAFLNLLRVFGESSSSSSSRELIERVRDLLRGHEGLLDGFRAYLPEGYDDDRVDGGEVQREEKPTTLPSGAQTADVVMSWRESCADLPSIEDLSERMHVEFTTCKFCNGKRNAVACKNSEPILLCELKGCNREYHLRCLPRGLTDKGDEGDAEDAKGRNDDIIKYVMNEKKEAAAAEEQGDDIPPGEIYCQQCAAEGSTSVLRQYFDRCDAIRSNFSCSRSYVMSLLEKHMWENLVANANDLASGSNDADDVEQNSTKVRLKPPPRSELWSVEEMDRMALDFSGGKGVGDCAPDKTRANKDVWKAAEFLIGKPVRLYCNLDNEYHNGRIVDWRTCSVYPHVNRIQKTSKNRDINDLDYYGIGPISTCEFLVRFPSGSEGRKKDLLQWMLLEEHSLAVGITLVRGKIRSPKTRVWGWKPAMILARSALELVPVREFLFEGSNGELFQNMEKDGKKQLRRGVSRDLWALTSFFGGDNFAVLNLRDEVQALITKDLLASDDLKDGISSGFVGDKETREPPKQRSTSPSKKSAIQPESRGGKDKLSSIKQHPCSSIPVKLGLALVEYNEQRRCKDWYKTILRDPTHPMALTSADEHSLDMATGGVVDRMHVADVALKACPPVERSRDCLMSFDTKRITAMSDTLCQKLSVEDEDMSDGDTEMVEYNGNDYANTNTEERSESFDNEQGDLDEDKDADLNMGYEIEEEYDEGIYADYDIVESFEDDESVTSDDGMMSTESSRDSEDDDLSALGVDRKSVMTKQNEIKVIRTGKPGRPRHVLHPVRSISESDAVLGIQKGQTVVRGKKVAVDVVRTGGRGRPRHVNMTTGTEITEGATKIEGIKKPFQQSAPTPMPEPQKSPVEAKKTSPKPPAPKLKAAKPKSKPTKPVEETGDEDDSDAIDIPRGITMRPSGKWQAQLYYAGKSRYLGVFKDRKTACVAYEVARKYLKNDDAQNATQINEINFFISNARKLANEGVKK